MSANMHSQGANTTSMVNTHTHASQAPSCHVGVGGDSPCRPTRSAITLVAPDGTTVAKPEASLCNEGCRGSPAVVRTEVTAAHNTVTESCKMTYASISMCSAESAKARASQWGDAKQNQHF